MYVDVGLGHWLSQKYLAWLRRRRRPHGAYDPYYRGVRLEPNRVAKLSACTTSVVLLTGAGFLFLGPDIFEKHERWLGLAVKVGWIGITLVALLAPLEAFRSFVIVSDEGLRKRNLFGRETRLDWDQVKRIEAKPQGDELVFRGFGNGKLTVSLTCDGLEDLQQYADKRLTLPLSSALRALLVGT